MRNAAVETQPSHIDQKFNNLLEKQKERMEQWEAAVVEQLKLQREIDNAALRKEFSDQLEEFKNGFRELKEHTEQYVVQTSSNMEHELNNRITHLEEELKRHGKDVNRGDEMRVTSAINDLRREIDQKDSVHSGRFQHIYDTISDITTKYTELQTIVNRDRLSGVGSLLKNRHRRRVPVVRGSGGKNLVVMLNPH